MLHIKYILLIAFQHHQAHTITIALLHASRPANSLYVIEFQFTFGGQGGLRLTSGGEGGGASILEVTYHTNIRRVI